MREIGAFLLIAAGAVWMAQGLGLLRGRSFMVDDLRWTVIGGFAVAVGLAIALLPRRRA